MPIDSARPFVPVQLAILTVSDTRSSADDKSGDLLVERATTAGHTVVARRIVPDDQATIERTLRELVAAEFLVDLADEGFAGIGFRRQCQINFPEWLERGGP